MNNVLHCIYAYFRYNKKNEQNKFFISRLKKSNNILRFLIKHIYVSNIDVCYEQCFEYLAADIGHVTIIFFPRFST